MSALPEQRSSRQGDPPLNLAGLKRLAWRAALAALVLGAVTAVLVFFAASFLESEYQSTARVLPPSLYSAPSRIGIFSNEGLSERIPDQLSVRYQSDIAMSVLKSATVLDAVVKKLDLTQHFGVKTPRAARDTLTVATRISSGRDGVIAIQVTDRDSVKAADMANAYLDSLERYVVNFINTNARLRADTIRLQLNLAQQRLAQTDAAFVDVQSRTGIVKLPGDGVAVTANLTDLRQRLAVRQAQLRAMQAYATPANPGYVRMSAEVDGLLAQIRAIVGISPVPVGSEPDGAKAAQRSSSQQESLYQRALRDVRGSEEAVDALRKQLAQAEFEAVSTLAGLQVIERAAPNELRSGPRRTLMAVTAAVAVALLVVLWFLWRVRLYRVRRNLSDPTLASADGP